MRDVSRVAGIVVSAVGVCPTSVTGMVVVLIVVAATFVQTDTVVTAQHISLIAHTTLIAGESAELRRFWVCAGGRAAGSATLVVLMS